MSDSEKEWISMRNAVIRLHDPEERRSDRQIEISHAGWPQMDLDLGILDQFLSTAVTGHIQVRGLLTKISINENDAFVPEDNREYVIQRLNEDRSFKVNNQTMQSVVQYPFVVGKAIETDITMIPPSFWQKHGQIWQQNELVGFGCAQPEDHTKKLRPSFEISSTLAALSLVSSEYMQTHDMPEIYIYEQVEVKADSIVLQTSGVSEIVDGNDSADLQENQKGRGAKRNERWPDIISIAKNFILSKENFSTQKVLCNKVFDELNKQYTEWNKKNPEKKYKIKGPMTPYGLLDGLRKYDLEIYTQIKKQIGQKSK